MSPLWQLYPLLQVQNEHVRMEEICTSAVQKFKSKFGGNIAPKSSPQIEVKLRTMEGASAGSQHSPLASSSSIERQGGCMSGSVTPPLPKLYRGRPLAWENKFHAPPNAP